MWIDSSDMINWNTNSVVPSKNQWKCRKCAVPLRLALNILLHKFLGLVLAQLIYPAVKMELNVCVVNEFYFIFYYSSIGNIEIRWMKTQAKYKSSILNILYPGTWKQEICPCKRGDVLVISWSLVWKISIFNLLKYINGQPHHQKRMTVSWFSGDSSKRF